MWLEVMFSMCIRDGILACVGLKEGRLEGFSSQDAVSGTHRGF